jgi:NAD-dependent histone deacetylase SIR2
MIPEGHENEIVAISEADHVYSVKAKGLASQPIKEEIKHEAFDTVVHANGNANGAQP